MLALPLTSNPAVKNLRESDFFNFGRSNGSSREKEQKKASRSGEALLMKSGKTVIMQFF